MFVAEFPGESEAMLPVEEFPEKADVEEEEKVVVILAVVEIISW